MTQIFADYPAGEGLQRKPRGGAVLSSVSLLALMATSASALVLPPTKEPPATTQPPSRENQLSPAATQRATDKSLQREFTVFLKPNASSSAPVVESYFRGLGFSTEYHAATNAVKLHGTYAQAEAAGHFEYVPGNSPRVLIKPNVEPSFPSEVANAIQGTTFRRGPLLTPLALPKPPYGTPSTMPCYGAGANNCGFGPADYASLYDIPKSLNGNGETVDIAAFSTYCASDISKFQTTFGLTPAPNITATYLSGTPTGCGSGEPTLDLSRVYGTAPGAAIRIWFADAAFLSSLADIYEDIAADQTSHPASAVTTSYGLEENYLGLIYGSAVTPLISNVDTALDLITGGSAEKVALFAASGDRGAFCAICGSFDLDLEADGWLTVLFPASDQWVLAAGGTSLYPKKGASPGKDTREKEACWSGAADINFGGSGGGVSSIFSLPSWQKDVRGTASQTHKNVPDLSTVADPNTPPLFVYNGELLPTGGTSASSPTWAGIAALINQNRANHGAGRLTNWPREIYKVAHADLEHKPFTKITEGFNGFYGGSLDVYNNCAGLGAPNVRSLVDALK
jgi:subtilase family serine protease